MWSSADEAEWVGSLGRLRDVVRQHVVAAQLGAALAPRAPGSRRALDVGCGQGSQLVALARAGFTVTGLDPSRELLARCASLLDGEPEPVRHRVRLVQGDGVDAPDLLTGQFDVVLCHGVLMYYEDSRPLLKALTQVAADGAVLSLLVRNGWATAMRDGLRGEWAAALAAFDSQHYTGVEGVETQGHTPSQLDEATAVLGWRPLRWHGVRVFTDHLDTVPPRQEDLALLLAAELEAGSRDPYRQVAGLFHLLYERAESTVS